MRYGGHPAHPSGDVPASERCRFNVKKTKKLRRRSPLAHCEPVTLVTFPVVGQPPAPGLIPILADVTTAAKPHLNTREFQEFEELVAECADIFAKDNDDYGRTNKVYHHMGTGEARPIRQPPRRVPLAKLAEVNEMLDNMRGQGLYKNRTALDGSLSFLVTSREQPSPLEGLGTSSGTSFQRTELRLSEHAPLFNFQTAEEKRLTEEIKKTERKIRNRISAGESQRRKQEYIDGLEERVKHCTEENLHLVKRVEALQTEIQTLAARVKELEALLSHGATNTAQILSLNQSLSPNCDGQKDQDLSQPENKMAPLAGHSRNLLEFPESRVSEDGTFSSSNQDDAAMFISDMAELLQFNNPLVGDCDYEPPTKRSYTEEKPKDIMSSLLYAGINYIVPPADEIWPPPAPEDGHISNTLEGYWERYLLL
ncbi:cyclic AMP-responsive element-binding protein 3-like protein 2 [Cryptotermes secundus]|nr:cyclic AMP-responsive element-binding protein 3-like protein 2 [Cryptotermes secundus]